MPCRLRSTPHADIQICGQVIGSCWVVEIVFVVVVAVPNLCPYNSLCWLESDSNDCASSLTDKKIEDPTPKQENGTESDNRYSWLFHLE